MCSDVKELVTERFKIERQVFHNTICQAVTAQLMQGSENYFVADIWDYNYRLPDIEKILRG